VSGLNKGMTELEWLTERSPKTGDRDAWLTGVRDWCRATSTALWPVPESSALYYLSTPPAYLFRRGAEPVFETPWIAIVGTRRPHPTSVAAAYSFARAFAERGLPVVSGLAQGVDGASHRGALAGGGKTVAVLGHGLDRVYPAAHESLARAILNEGGALLSEYVPGTPPLKHHFPQRNRIIAGLVRGVVVIEAAEKSGSLITAQFALEEGRDVFVLPGNFSDPGFVGSHRLLKEGATLVTAPEDIFRAWGIESDASVPARSPSSLTDCFHDGSATLDFLLSKSGLSVDKLFEELERGMREGWLVETSAQTYSRIDFD